MTSSLAAIVRYFQCHPLFRNLFKILNDSLEKMQSFLYAFACQDPHPAQAVILERFQAALVKICCNKFISYK